MGPSDHIQLLNNMLEALHAYIEANKKILKKNKDWRETVCQVIKQIYICFGISDSDIASSSFEIDWFLSEMNFKNEPLKSFFIMKEDPIAYSEKFNDTINAIKEILKNVTNPIKEILDPYLAQAKYAYGFKDFPKEIYLHVFSFLDNKSLCRMGITNKVFKQMTETNFLWKERTVNKYELDDENKQNELLTKYGLYKNICKGKPFSSFFLFANSSYLMCVSYDKFFYTNPYVTRRDLITIMELGVPLWIENLQSIQNDPFENNLYHGGKRYAIEVNLPADKAMMKLATSEGRTALLDFITKIHCITLQSIETVNLTIKEKSIIISKEEPSVMPDRPVTYF